jgi:2-hydroxy-3-keto-5-methylthiopentenyl-1-phosphate phosphatase
MAERMEVVVDWDGTVTEVDGLHLVLEEFGGRGIYHEAEERLGRALSLHEVIALEFETVRAPLEEVAGWVRENVDLRPGFGEFALRHRPLVVSSGFHELIEPVLQREGIEVELRANRVDVRGDGWRVRFRNDTACPACGEPCKRADVAALGPFAYVGDGYSDRCVSLAAARVFARDGLARYLDGLGHPFERFTDFVDLAGRIDGGAGELTGAQPGLH